MADMSNEKWLASLRIELLQAGRWVEITSQTADRLEESDRQLAEYRNTPTTDDSELQGELELVREELDSLRKERHDAWKAASQILLLHGCDDTSLTDGVQQLSDKLTEERKRSAEYVKLIGDMYQVCRSHGFPRDGGDEYEAVRQLADALTAERAKVAELQARISTPACHDPEVANIAQGTSQRGLDDRLRDDLYAATRELQQKSAMIEGQSLTIRRLTEENERLVAAAAQRAQESQLEPVGWFYWSLDDVPDAESCDWWIEGLHCRKATRRRVYLGPAEPIVSNKGKAVTE